MDIYAHRRRHLKSLIDTEFNGSQKEFAEHIGVKAPQVSRWLSGTTSDARNISEASARAIEAKCGKLAGWLDSADLLGEAPDKDEDNSLALDAANVDEQKELLLRAWSAAGDQAKQLALMWAKTVLAGEQDRPID
ncbi:helix-turn-helix domain-containing protein [Burkholderia gladioli]|uniref:helix-turn-helix domain-containing protein n=1 Tax=Burkholderia gladioli TaxID=28095 RepID=UPI0034DB6916